MKAMFVNQLSRNGVPYADAIAAGLKPIETRNRNMLFPLLGERVAVVRTVSGKVPVVVGYVTVFCAEFNSGEWMDQHRHLTLIPAGSKYDNNGKGKWCYWLRNAETCEPFPLPSSAIRHGRSWCEF